MANTRAMYRDGIERRCEREAGRKIRRKRERGKRVKASRSLPHPSSRSRASRSSSLRRFLLLSASATDEGEDDFADSLVYFAYSPYNNNDNDNNDDNNIPCEIRIGGVNRRGAFASFQSGGACRA